MDGLHCVAHGAAMTSGEEDVVAPAALLQPVPTPAALPAPTQPVPAPEQLQAPPAQRSPPLPASHAGLPIISGREHCAALRFWLRASLENP